MSCTTRAAGRAAPCQAHTSAAARRRSLGDVQLRAPVALPVAALLHAFVPAGGVASGRREVRAPWCMFARLGGGLGGRSQAAENRWRRVLTHGPCRPAYPASCPWCARRGACSCLHGCRQGVVGCARGAVGAWRERSWWRSSGARDRALGLCRNRDDARLCLQAREERLGMMGCRQLSPVPQCWLRHVARTRRAH